MTQIRAVRIYNYISRLRKAIRREGTPAVQDAWDKLEPHISVFLYDDKTSTKENEHD